MTTDHDNLTPRERALAQSLDRSAASFRAEPDAGFESRVLAAAMHAEPEPPVIATIRPRVHSLLGVAAAAVVLLAFGAVALVSMRGAGAPPASAVVAQSEDVLDDIDAWLALDDGVFRRANLTTFRAELESADTPVSFDNVGQSDIDLEEWM